MITPGLLESQYDGSEKKKTTKRTLKITRIHRWENWGLSVDHTHIINQWSSQCSFLSEESTPISVGTLLPIFLNKCQFSKTHFSFFFFKTHFSWHYANKGKETEWPSVQRAGNEACLGPHTPLGHVVVSQKHSERSRPLSISVSWVSPPLGHGWGVATPNFPQEYWPKCITSGCQQVLLPQSCHQKLLSSPALISPERNVDFFG